MTEDIVNQLRTEPVARDLRVCEDAANYIETLRREVHYWYEKWRDLEVGRVND